MKENTEHGFNVGDRLPNGAILLASKQADTAISGGRRIVLAYYNEPMPYVVWTANRYGDCENGHYFRTVGAAAKKFTETT